MTVVTYRPTHHDVLPESHGTICPVLIVEDDPELREMMAQMLELEGFAPEVACDGLEAWQRLHTTGPRPHVILLDMMMPRMDGWTFCEEQSHDPAIADIPVVVLSAAPPERLEQVPAAAVLQKPFEYEELLATVRAHC